MVMLFTEIRDTGGRASLLSESVGLVRNSSCLEGKGYVHWYSGSHELRDGSHVTEADEPILFTMGEEEKGDAEFWG